MPPSTASSAAATATRSSCSVSPPNMTASSNPSGLRARRHWTRAPCRTTQGAVRDALHEPADGATAGSGREDIEWYIVKIGQARAKCRKGMCQRFLHNRALPAAVDGRQQCCLVGGGPAWTPGVAAEWHACICLAWRLPSVLPAAQSVRPPVAPCAGIPRQDVVRQPLMHACSTSPLTVMRQLFASPTSIGKPCVQATSTYWLCCCAMGAACVKPWASAV